MGSAAALLYITVSMSHEVVASNLDPADILKWHVEKAVRGIPERVYAVDRRRVINGVNPPWELWDVKQGGSHVDPLAMDLYSIRLYSQHLEALSHEERLFAQRMLDNVPEGALLPPDYAAWVSSLPGNRYDTGRNQATLGVQKTHHKALYGPTAREIQAMYDNNLIPGDKARIMLGLEPKGRKP